MSFSSPTDFNQESEESAFRCKKLNAKKRMWWTCSSFITEQLLTTKFKHALPFHCFGIRRIFFIVLHSSQYAKKVNLPSHCSLITSHLFVHIELSAYLDKLCFAGSEVSSQSSECSTPTNSTRKWLLLLPSETL